jgi:hypothetical protein
MRKNLIELSQENLRHNHETIQLPVNLYQGEVNEKKASQIAAIISN